VAAVKIKDAIDQARAAPADEMAADDFPGEPSNPDGTVRS